MMIKGMSFTSQSVSQNNAEEATEVHWRHTEALVLLKGCNYQGTFGKDVPTYPNVPRHGKSLYKTYI